MKRKRTVLLAAIATGVTALGALPSSSQAQDFSSVCGALGIPSATQNINLSPLVNVNLATCGLATAPQCSDTSIPLNLGIVRTTISLCKPL